MVHPWNLTIKSQRQCKMQSSSERWSERGEVRYGRGTSSPECGFHDAWRPRWRSGALWRISPRSALASFLGFFHAPSCRPCSPRGSAWSRTKGGYGLLRLWIRSFLSVSREIYSVLSHDKIYPVAVNLSIAGRRFHLDSALNPKERRNFVFKK